MEFADCESILMGYHSTLEPSMTRYYYIRIDIPAPQHRGFVLYIYW